MRKLWKKTGVEILGGFTSLLGLLGIITPAELHAFGVNLHSAYRATVVAAGLATILKAVTDKMQAKKAAQPAA